MAGEYNTDECILVVTERGIDRMTKRAGALKPNERAVRVRVAIPQSWFYQPEIMASIVIPEAAITSPNIDALGLPSPIGG